MSLFLQAFAIVVGEEGGYVNDPQDPGGETKYGITKRRYPAEDIPALTLDRARFLYQRDYWNPHHCEFLPWAEALLVFDTAVNGGNADHWHSMFAGSPDFISNYQAEHVLYLAGLPGWTHDGRGWARRLIRLAFAAQRIPT